MKPATFFLTLSTCKHLLNAAHSKPLLLYQINRLPGLRLGLEDLTAQELIRRYRSRAAHQSISARTQASVSHYKSDPYYLIARSAHVQHSYTRSISRYTTVAVPTQTGTIQLYDCSKRLVKRREELQIRREDGDPSQLHILKTAFAEETKDLAALCSWYEYPEEISSARPFQVDRFSHP